MPVKKNTPTVLTVLEVAKILRIGRISAYQAIARGDVPSIRIGRRIHAAITGGQYERARAELSTQDWRETVGSHRLPRKARREERRASGRLSVDSRVPYTKGRTERIKQAPSLTG